MKRVTPESEAAILRHSLVDKWPVGTIATQLAVHHDVVRRVLAQHGMPVPELLRRSRIEDPYVDFIVDTLTKYPRLHGSRLFQMAQQRGYPGSQSHFRRVVARYRPRKEPEPFLQLSKLPAEEAQVDWGCFGSVQIGRARRNLYAFVMTLSWSRMTWLQFFFDMQMANFQQGHVDAFCFFGGVPRKLLFDNLKSAVIERDGNAIRFNERLLQLASYYGFEPRAAAPRRGNEKGRVERSIRYVRDNFFAAREFHNIRQLNEEARAWSIEVAAKRRWPQDDTRQVCEIFAEERSKLRPLPDNQFPAHERKTVSVGRTPWLRFDTNNYSVPPRYVRRSVDVLADHEQVRVVADGKLIAEHQRSFDRRESIEDPSHTEELKAFKRKARQASAGDRLRAAAPSVEEFLYRGAERGHNLGGLTSTLIGLLDTHGGPALAAAVVIVNARNIVSANAVRLVLEQQARAAGRKPPTPVRLPRQELAELSVREVDLSSYDAYDPEDADA